MYKNVKLSTKIMTTAIGCMVIPIFITLAIIQLRATGMKQDIHSVVQKTSESELENIAKGVYETLNESVNAAIRLDCQTTALNAMEGVKFFYDQSEEGKISEKEAKQMAARYLLSQKIGESGYIYVLSKQGTILVHPKSELIGQDLRSYDFIREQISTNGSGFFEYSWKNPGEQVARQKSLAQEIFEPWGWIISATAYKTELAKETKAQIEASLRETILEKEIGESGYVYILGGKGEDKGHYIVSNQGKRDGEDIWHAKDSDGHFFIQSIVNRAVNLKPGEIATQRYPWQNRSEKTPRMKIAKIAYFAPWDWVIGSGGYEDEIGIAASLLENGISSMIIFISIIYLILVVAGSLVSYLLSKSITKPINRVIQSLNDSAGGVASAAGQVSSSSQFLAEGASEQAASIEETSSSLEEMSSMTKQNADNAGQADTLMKEANQVVDLANASMTELTGSMEDISKASEETSNIIKTIDEIAFQTNLLALNAAVEAARAGEAGAGFAVVADEVRNLAMRAAEAAKNTADLIEGTVKKVAEGADLVTKTNDAFGQVAESARKVGSLVGEIAAASGEQAQGIDQVNTAVADMDKVTQQNASNAEESASAAEEMSAQAEQMKASVAELVRMVGVARQGKGHTSAPSTRSAAQPTRQALTAPAKRTTNKENTPEQVIPLGDQYFTEF